MGVPLEGLTDLERKKTENFVEKVTPSLITRSLEILGVALVEMRRAPDPRIDLEVALVKMTRDQTSADSSSIDVLESRVAHLEKMLALVNSTDEVNNKKDKRGLANTETNSSSEETKLISDSQDIKKSEDSENMQKVIAKQQISPLRKKLLIHGQKICCLNFQKKHEQGFQH